MDAAGHGNGDEALGPEVNDDTGERGRARSRPWRSFRVRARREGGSGELVGRRSRWIAGTATCCRGGHDRCTPRDRGEQGNDGSGVTWDVGSFGGLLG